MEPQKVRGSNRQQEVRSLVIAGGSAGRNRLTNELLVALQFRDRRLRQQGKRNGAALGREFGCGQEVADHRRALLQPTLPMVFARVAKDEAVGMESHGS